MASGPKYGRLQQTHRNDRKFIDERMHFKTKDAESAKLSTSKYKCKNCGHIMFYKTNTCPSCDKSGMFEEVK